jgi:uncharacterized protein (TIGR02271 family)
MGLGDKIMRALTGDDWHREDEVFRERHTALGSSDLDYEKARPAYQYGYAAGTNERFRGRQFDEIENDLRGEWDTEYASTSGGWDGVRGYVNRAYQRGQESVVTRSEEELSVGTRTVSAGEVAVHKTVETEHVREQVPVMREEVTVERRPVDEVRADAAEIGAQEVRVPLQREEAVAEKRAVVKEEIVVRKEAVRDTETVEADLRKERVQVDDTSRSADRVADGTTDRADDLRDR